jgi:hypothetical protein
VASGVPQKIEQMEVVALIAYMQRLGIDYTTMPEPAEIAQPSEVTP